MEAIDLFQSGSRWFCDLLAKKSSQQTCDQNTMPKQKLEIETMKWELIVDPSQKFIFNWQCFVFLVELKRFGEIPFVRNPFHYRVSTHYQQCYFMFSSNTSLRTRASPNCSWVANTQHTKNWVKKKQ